MRSQVIPKGRLGIPPLRHIVFFAALALAAAGFTVCRSSSRATPRHLVLIVLDTVRADHLSAYGYERETTPYLERLTRESVRFARAKAAAPWTVPSHASLFTGLWPAEHKAQWGRMVLDEAHLTLAEILGAKGFATIALSSNAFISPSFGFGQGFEVFRRIQSAPELRTGEILEAAPELLDEIVRSGRRLFLFVNLMDAHIPFNAARHAGAFGVTDPLATGDHGLKWRVNAGQVPYGPRLTRQQNAAYDAAIRYTDDAVRVLVGMLEERRLLEQTLLVVTSDHGEGLGAHPELGHSISTWEEQLAVPLLVSNPHGRRGGEVSTALTSLVALVPTALDELGVARPLALEDRPDLYHAHRAQISADYRSYFSERVRRKNTGMARRYPRLAARIRHTHVLYCDPYKLSVDASGRVRLFDLGRDRAEARDLADSADEARRACEASYRQLLRNGRYTPFDQAISSEEQRRMEEVVDPELLRSMGYLE